jgi:K+-transporting ATPase ATPase A chain
MQTDEVIFGGVGAGLYGMLLYAILGVFIAGLMVGRTPEYIGKKIQQKEVKMALFAVLATSFLILVFSGVSIVLPFAKGSYWNPQGPAFANLSNAGPHGLSEILYAYTSASENNGSAFAGLSANTPFYNTTIGLAMLVGRFFVIVPMLAIAGALAAKNISPPSAGTFPTDSGLFVGLLVGVIAIVGGLTYFPAVALGPLAEHFAMQAGTLY